MKKYWLRYTTLSLIWLQVTAVSSEAALDGIIAHLGDSKNWKENRHFFDVTDKKPSGAISDKSLVVITLEAGE